MAIGIILRKSVSKAAPIATRLLGSQRNAHSAAATTALSACNRLALYPLRFIRLAEYFSGRRFCTATAVSDDDEDVCPEEEILKIVKSKLKAVEQSEDLKTIVASGDIPFTVKDYPWERMVTLTREYNGEIITLKVYMPNLTDEEDDGEDDDYNEEPRVPLVVTVSKEDDDISPYLSFDCTAFPDKIRINDLSLKYPDENNEAYEGRHFSDLDENIQKGFQKYLEIKGVKPSIANILHECIIAKENKEYARFLKEIKRFVQEESDDKEEEEEEK